MPKKKSDKDDGAGSHLPRLIDPLILKAIDHVLRQHILMTALYREVSPKQLERLLGEGVAQISYHVNVLRDECGLLEQTRTEPRRGAVEHFYRATVNTLLPAKAWRGVDEGLRSVVGAGMANDLFGDLAQAFEAGKLKGDHDEISRILLLLDAEGQRKVGAIARRAVEEAEDEQRAAADRLGKSNAEKPTPWTFGLLSFEAAWEVAGTPPPAAPGDDAGPKGSGGKGSGGKGSRGKKGGRRGSQG